MNLDELERMYDGRVPAHLRQAAIGETLRQWNALGNEAPKAPVPVLFTAANVTVRRRVERIVLPKMIECVRELLHSQGGITAEDLTRRGFTQAEVDTYAVRANNIVTLGQFA